MVALYTKSYFSCQYKCNVDSTTNTQCGNTRDNGDGANCNSQLANGQSCQNYLLWKDCDQECSLCACSTGTHAVEHCSGHGTCEASCTDKTCHNARCKCDDGWTGDKCQLTGIETKMTFRKKMCLTQMYCLTISWTKVFNSCSI